MAGNQGGELVSRTLEIDTDPAVLLSRIADALESFGGVEHSVLLSRLADTVERLTQHFAGLPVDPSVPAELSLEVQVVSNTYVVDSRGSSETRHVTASLQFPLKEDPLWKAGQTVTLEIRRPKEGGS